MDFFDVARTQRAMRRLKPDPISDEDLWTILETATMAPSGGNRQPWNFIVVRDPEKKRKIGAWYLEAWEKAYGRSARRCEPTPARARTYNSADHLARPHGGVPVLIIATINKGQFAIGPTLGASIYPAVQNLMLAARALGLGTTLTTLHKLHEDDVKQLLGIPDDVETMALIPLGVPLGKFGTPERLPVEKVVYWDEWKATRTRRLTHGAAAARVCVTISHTPSYRPRSTLWVAHIALESAPKASAKRASESSMRRGRCCSGPGRPARASTRSEGRRRQTRATVYQHFGSRGDLLIAVAADTLERADVSRVIAALQDPDALNALRRVLTEGCRIWAAERLTFSQIGSLGVLDAGIAELNEQQEQVKHMFLVPLINRMEEQGLLRAGLSVLDAALLVEAATRFEAFDHLYTRHKLSLAKTTAMLIRIAEAAILCDGAAPSSASGAATAVEA